MSYYHAIHVPFSSGVGTTSSFEAEYHPIFISDKTEKLTRTYNVRQQRGQIKREGYHGEDRKL
jgi:hypothetical protein